MHVSEFFCGSDLRFRFWLFASIYFEPRTQSRSSFAFSSTGATNRFAFGIKFGRFVVRIFSGLWPFRTKMGRFSDRICSSCDLSEQKTGRFVARNGLQTQRRIYFLIRCSWLHFFGSGRMCCTKFRNLLVWLLFAFLNPIFFVPTDFPVSIFELFLMISTSSSLLLVSCCCSY